MIHTHTFLRFLLHLWLMGKDKSLKFLIDAKLLKCSACKTFIVKCYHEVFVNDFFPLRLSIKHAVLKLYLYTVYKLPLL